MSPVNHFFTGWLIANTDQSLSGRERAAITIACIIPDIDGFGIVAEALTRDSENPITWWSEYHHALAHNIFFGLALAIIVFMLSSQRWKASFLTLLAFHAHLLEDIFSGRSPDGSIWTIRYFFPLSDWEWQWQGQMELNAWPNFVVAVALLGVMFYLAWRRGFSPLEMISRKADRKFVDTLRQRFGKPAGEKP